MNSVIEVVTYHIKPEYIDSYHQVDLPRFQNLVKNLVGFRSYRSYRSCNLSSYHLDLVEWESIEHAVAAAESVQKLQQYLQYRDYLNAFEKVEIFHHFKPVI